MSPDAGRRSARFRRRGEPQPRVHRLRHWSARSARTRPVSRVDGDGISVKSCAVSFVAPSVTRAHSSLCYVL